MVKSPGYSTTFFNENAFGNYHRLFFFHSDDFLLTVRLLNVYFAIWTLWNCLVDRRIDVMNAAYKARHYGSNCSVECVCLWSMVSECLVLHYDCLMAEGTDLGFIIDDWYIWYHLWYLLLNGLLLNGLLLLLVRH